MPKTVLPNSRITPRFAGICTFCRYPRIEDVAPENRPLDWAIYGGPFDSGVTFRPGARFGPRAIREASQYVKAYHVEHGVDVCEKLSMADAGDAPVKPYHLKENLEAIAAWAAKLGDAKTRLFAVGGEHTLAYANIKATWEKQGRPKGGLALVHFDAHLDTVDQVWDEKWGHASPFRRVIEEGFVDPKAMLSIGVRGPLNRADDLEFARSHGVQVISAEDVHGGPIGDGGASEHALGVASNFSGALGNRPLYITFDVDVLDPAFAPGTGTPCPGGLTSAQAFALVRVMASALRNVVGGDVVEVLPERDAAGITSMVAAHAMFEILALSAAYKDR